MTLLRPFRALMPRPECAQAVAAPPYDVPTAAEARAGGRQSASSFLHMSRPEIDLPESAAADAPEAYAKAAGAMRRLRADGVLSRADAPSCYLYRVSAGGHRQTGIAGAVPVAALADGRLRRHEQTRPDKVADRARQIAAVGAHTGPVMLAHREDPALARLLARVARRPPTLRAETGGAVHEVWVPAADDRRGLEDAAAGLAALYVADGHHRCAAAAELAARGGGAAATLLGVSFPATELRILAYHRALRDLNGLTADGLRGALAADFAVEPADGPVAPARPGLFGMYLPGAWHRLAPRCEPAGTAGVDRLDTALFARSVLDPVFGIDDPTRDDRVVFVGGGRGPQGVQRLVDSGEMAAAFTLYPTSMADLLAVADSGGVMPPKSTWFDPKLADGLLSLPLE